MKVATLLVASILSITAAIPFVACSTPASAQAQNEHRREVEIMVHGAFSPDKIKAVEGETLRLKFLRHDTGSCTKEVVFPSLGIRRELPTNEVVTIDLPALSAGEVHFECGMGMIKATITVAKKS